MKNVLLFGLFFIFLIVSFVSADTSISDTLTEIINSVNSYEDVQIIHGDNVAPEDYMGTALISGILPMFDENLGMQP